MSAPFARPYAEDNDQDADLTRHHSRAGIADIALEVVATGRTCLERLSAATGRRAAARQSPARHGRARAVEELVRRRRAMPVVMVTGVGDEELAVKALRLGASTTCRRPASYLETLPDLLRDGLEKHRLGGRRAVASGRRRVLYVEHDPADIDLTLRHFGEAAPHFDVGGRRSLQTP